MTPAITLLPFMVLAGITSLTARISSGSAFSRPRHRGEMIQQGLNNLQAPWVAMSAIARCSSP